jgi:LDH2 family malate/lactate/ureidoglycolate dehydrogenase
MPYDLITLPQNGWQGYGLAIIIEILCNIYDRIAEKED